MRSVDPTRRRRNLQRKRAEHYVPAERCELCGDAVGKIPRHHPDIDNHPNWVIVLCDKCHVREDQRLRKNFLGSKWRRIKPSAPTEPPAKAIKVI